MTIQSQPKDTSPTRKRLHSLLSLFTKSRTGSAPVRSNTELAQTCPNASTAEEYDVVVVGSGAAEMTTALTAAKGGLSVSVIEKAAYFGGSTARSEAGIPDTPELGKAYMTAVVGPSVSVERIDAYLEIGSQMVDFVMANTPLNFFLLPGYSDYYPGLQGAMVDGRSIETEYVDLKRLGPNRALLYPPYIPRPSAVVIYGPDYKWLTLVAVSAKGSKHHSRPAVLGAALAAGLRIGLMDANVPVWLNSPMVDLIQEGGTITGVVVNRDGVQSTIRARKGVIICSGGFEYNAEMREKYQQQPTGWSMGSKENTGDGIRAGEMAGAALGLMEDSWLGPAIPFPEGTYFCLAERTLPGGIFVNKHGKRSVNEAAPYCEAVHVMYEKDRDKKGSTIPAWMIVDQRYRNSYVFQLLAPRMPLPKLWYDSGVARKASTLAELAAQIEVPADALEETVARLNSQARAGKDDDFGRGDSAYDHYYTYPKIKPNSCPAPIEKGPFYAFKIVPGDLGTKGGIMTDAHARALRADNTVIRGLYAAENASAAMMGNSYAGPGSTIGPAMTFGYVAANHIADS
ncbi:hypothetical protein BGX26_005353 [Mortierella sp. AD094]|nr:hypothetical protein BGX26_005353 [Mortierella sp. AD094]